MDTNNEMVQRSPEELEDVRAVRRVAPPVDVYENDDELLLVLDVPGVSEDAFHIHLEGGKLELEACQPQPPEGLDYEPVVFTRSFTVPNSIDADKVAAELEMGVLKVHLPKSAAAKPRRIAVTAN